MAVNHVTIEGFANYVKSGEWEGRDGGEATPWCSFSLAHQSYGGKNRDTGETKWNENYFPVKIKGGLAKLAADTLNGTGRRVLVTGYLQMRSYTDDNGSNRQVVEIVATDLRRLDSLKSFDTVGVGGGGGPAPEDEEPF